MNKFFTPKMFLLGVGLFVTCLYIFACNINNKENNERAIAHVVDPEVMKQAVQKWKFNSTSLFKYNNADDAIVQMDAFVNSVITKTREDLFYSHETSNYIFQLRLNNGTAVLTKLYFVDVDTEQVIEAGIFNDQLTHIKAPEGIDWFGIAMSTACAPGFTHLGSCATNFKQRDCMSEDLKNFLTKKIYNEGVGVEIQINVGVIDTGICARSLQ